MSEPKIYTEAELNALSLTELRALADAETGAPVAPPVTTEPTTEQPRDANGRFVAPQPVVEAPAPVPVIPPAPVTPTVFRRVIDLGDGSGTQVFEASSVDALLDKLADAQTHATRKIRELNQAQKNTPAPAKTKRTADEEWVLAQRLMTNPSEVLEEMIADRVASHPDVVEAKQVSQKVKNDHSANSWVAAHPDYHGNEYNGNKMTQYIQKFLGGSMTPENLDKAFTDLNSAGLLQAKPAAADPTPAPVVVPVADPPAPRSSSLPTRLRTAALPTAEPTEADLYKMPIEELRRLGGGGGGDWR